MLLPPHKLRTNFNMRSTQYTPQYHGGLTSDTSFPLAQVIVVEDENGNIVRETMKDTDTLARYKTMHETLVYLSHLDHDDTENQMLEKLRLQVGTYCCRLHSALCLQ